MAAIKTTEIEKKSAEEMSIYNNNNPYGYRLNVNHPRIRELYDRYKKWKDIAGRPPTDEERREFERIIMKKQEFQRNK